MALEVQVHPFLQLDGHLQAEHEGLSVELLEVVKQSLVEVLNLLGRDEVKVLLEAARVSSGVVGVIRDSTHRDARETTLRPFTSETNFVVQFLQ